MLLQTVQARIQTLLLLQDPLLLLVLLLLQEAEEVTMAVMAVDVDMGMGKGVVDMVAGSGRFHQGEGCYQLGRSNYTLHHQ